MYHSTEWKLQWADIRAHKFDLLRRVAWTDHFIAVYWSVAIYSRGTFSTWVTGACAFVDMHNYRYISVSWAMYLVNTTGAWGRFILINQMLETWNILGIFSYCLQVLILQSCLHSFELSIILTTIVLLAITLLEVNEKFILALLPKSLKQLFECNVTTFLQTTSAVH